MTTVPDDEDEVQEAEPMSTPQLVLSISGWIWLWFAIVVAIWSAGIGWFLSLSPNTLDDRIAYRYWRRVKGEF